MLYIALCTNWLVVLIACMEDIYVTATSVGALCVYIVNKNLLRPVVLCKLYPNNYKSHDISIHHQNRLFLHSQCSVNYWSLV